LFIFVVVADFSKFMQSGIELVTAYCDLVNPGIANRRHHRDTCFAVWHILEGNVCMRSGGHEVVAGPGRWLVLSGQQMRDQLFAAGSQIVSIRFRLNPARGIQFSDPGFHVLQEPEKSGFAALSFELVENYNRLSRLRSGEFGLQEGFVWSELLLRWTAAWHHQVSGLVVAEMVPDDQRVVQMMQYLSAQTGLVADYAELSGVSGLSRSQIDRLFQAEGLPTPPAMLQRQALMLAEQRLLASPEPVKSIAADLGFCDAAHFSHWFKRQVGQTPREYRIEPR
jgi:AraC-like DNA-binding protein